MSCAIEIPRRLPQNAIAVLLNGRHAGVGGKTPRMRGQNLLRIAASYTREELLAEKGIGPHTVKLIEVWLKTQGLALRQEAGGCARRDDADRQRQDRLTVAANVSS